MLDVIKQLMGNEAAVEARTLASRLHWAMLSALWILADYDFPPSPALTSSYVSIDRRQ